MGPRRNNAQPATNASSKGQGADGMQVEPTTTKPNKDPDVADPLKSFIPPSPNPKSVRVEEAKNKADDDTVGDADPAEADDNIDEDIGHDSMDQLDDNGDLNESDRDSPTEEEEESVVVLRARLRKARKKERKALKQQLANMPEATVKKSQHEYVQAQQQYDQSHTVNITTTTQMPVLSEASGWRSINRFMFSVNQKIAGVKGDAERIDRLVSQKAQLQLRYYYLSLEPEQYPEDEQDNFLKRPWVELEPILKAIVELIKPKPEMNMQTPYQELVHKATRLEPIEQDIDMMDLRQTYQPFSLRVMKLHDDYNCHWSEWTDSERTTVLHELIKRICLKATDRYDVRHPLRELALDLHKKISEKSITTLLEFAMGVTVTMRGFEKEYSVNANRCGLTKNVLPPMPQAVRPIRYISEGDSLKCDDDEDVDEDRPTKRYKSRDDDHSNKGYKSTKSKGREQRSSDTKGPQGNKRLGGTNDKESPAEHKARLKRELRQWYIDERKSLPKGDPKGTSDNKYPKGTWKCWGCGHVHMQRVCLLLGHPDYNGDDCPWDESDKGQRWANKDRHSLPPNETLSGYYVEVPKYEQMLVNKQKESSDSSAGKKTSKQGKPFCDNCHYLNTIPSKRVPNHALLPSGIRHRSIEIPTLTLIDTGATGENYISRDLADALITQLGMMEHHYPSNNKPKACTAINIGTAQEKTQCVIINSYIYIDLILKDILPTSIKDVFYNKRLNNLCFSIIPMQYDIILGMPTITEHRLLVDLQNHIDKVTNYLYPAKRNGEDKTNAKPNVLAVAVPTIVEECTPTKCRCGNASGSTCTGCRSQLSSVPNTNVLLHRGLRHRVGWTNPVEQQWGDAFMKDPGHDSIGAVTGTAAPNVMKDQHLRRLNDLLLQPDNEQDADPFEGMVDIGELLIRDKSTGDDRLPKKQGDTKFHDDIHAICKHYPHVFSREVKPIAAHMEPLELKLKEDSDFQERNHAGPRRQAVDMQAEIHRQIQQMLRLKVIQKSRATAYSQVLLAKKPNNKWRFCIDYRNLNKNLRTEHWVIPNVRSMLTRIGSKGPIYFGVVDLTSGYHQAPLSANSRELAAFVTEEGIYEPLRVPMGVHVAPAYFQRSIASTIMAEDLYDGMEMYIDDIIIYASTEKEFCERLERLFKKCEKYNLTLNPDKCTLGVSSIEYVGHIIDSEGLHMSEEKIRKVVEFAKPVTVKQMQSFLGLANYFRDHIHHHADITYPLYQMFSSTEDRKGKTKLEWSETTNVAFERTKEAIRRCPKLFFPLDDKSYETIVETDASNYGIGAYMFQKRKDSDEKIPIAFLSKSLSSVEQRWSTIEKEQYAIFFALKQWEYLLRGRPFTLRTDHKNLLQMNDGSPKVLRWKMALQEFNCTVEHIPGKDNFIADQLSRLVEEVQNDELIDSIAAIGFQGNAPIPEDKQAIIDRFHNAKAGHLGKDKTILKMQEAGITPWHGINRHVTKAIRECPVCQKLSQKKPSHHIPPYTVSSDRPMQVLSMDTIGPITTVGKSKHDYKYILVMIDNFTRFVTLYPTRTTDAAEAAKHLLSHIGLFGQPEYIQTDRGSQFVNDTIQYMTRLTGVDFQPGIAYSKEENSIVERANKEVMRHLRAYIYDANVLDIWVDCIPLVQRIMNASPHSSTKVSPAKLLFGEAIDIDQGIFTDYLVPQGADSRPRTKNNIDLRRWIDDMCIAQRALIAKAQTHQNETNISHLVERAMPGPVTQFEPDSYVLVAYPETGFGRKPPTKLHTQLRGPRQVIRAVDPHHYLVRNLTTRKEDTVHITAMRKFYYDAARTNPTQVATRDDQEFFVERVLWHVGDFNDKKSLYFKVKYVDLPETDASDDLLKWKELRNVEALHTYLRNNGLDKHIPKNLEPGPVGGEEGNPAQIAQAADALAQEVHMNIVAAPPPLLLEHEMVPQVKPPPQAAENTAGRLQRKRRPVEPKIIEDHRIKRQRKGVKKTHKAGNKSHKKK